MYCEKEKNLKSKKINEITQPFLRRNFLAHLFGNGVGTFEKVVGTLQACLPQHCQLRLKHFHLHYVNLTFVLVDVRVQLHVMATWSFEVSGLTMSHDFPPSSATKVVFFSFSKNCFI